MARKHTYGVFVDGDVKSVVGQRGVPAAVGQKLRHVEVDHLVNVLRKLRDQRRCKRGLSRVRPQIYSTLQQQQQQQQQQGIHFMQQWRRWQYHIILS